MYRIYIHTDIQYITQMLVKDYRDENCKLKN